ncbi:MAG TPA: hypothetical protein VG537_00145 [Candidatus Kapabacteria bacterium]|jgi:hypothetical protein|nr:hypothetical protein [Candidatus Kapabacteria bacterium]
MHTRFTSILGLVTIALLLSANSAVAHSRSHTKAKDDAEEHVRKALAALQLAQPELQNAAGDFCGHRAAAIDAANTAVQQLTGALACMTGKALGYKTHKSGTLPNTRAAVKELKKARKDLANSDNTFCGNRDAALAAVDAAIAQLHLVLDCNGM